MNTIQEQCYEHGLKSRYC